MEHIYPGSWRDNNEQTVIFKISNSHSGAHIYSRLFGRILSTTKKLPTSYLQGNMAYHPRTIYTTTAHLANS